MITAKRQTIPTLLFVVLTSICLSANAQVPGLIQFSVAGRIQEGLPLVSLSREVVVMTRDGWLHSVDPTNPENQVKEIEGQYEPIDAIELRNQLRTEFGKDFEVVATQNFLVVQPRGRGDQWPKMFEQSHRGFVSYMSKRGVEVRQGRFPMVAIVFPDQASMYEEFEKQKLNVSRVSGIYSNNSNRVMTHDGGHKVHIAATVRHEAAHQSAFNTGVHSRLNDTPKWITEGIGQLFEPEAIATSSTASNRDSRINNESLVRLKQAYPGKDNPEFFHAISKLIEGDEMFSDSKQIENAYAVSWAMMFYLSERQPREFAKTLGHTSSRPPFTPYKRQSRSDDFELIVGSNKLEFSKRVRWFVESL